MKNMNKTNVLRVYPLTPMQEGILFHKMLDEKDDSYFVQISINISRAMNTEYARSALKLIAEKYDVLRTAFVYKNISAPRQVLLKEREIELIAADLSECENKEEALQEIKDGDIRRNFDLEKDSLLRVTMVKLESQKYIMLWSNHHIIMDGWCLSPLFGDFIRYYMGLENGSTYDELCRAAKREKKEFSSYEDYVRWILAQDRGEGLEYYRALLEGITDKCEIIPLEKPLKTEKNVAEYDRILEDSLKAEIEELCRKRRITENTFMETAWGIFLQKYTGQEDVVFGKVVSGRSAKLHGIEKMIGLFINTIPVRVNNVGDKLISELLQETQRQAADSGRYEYCPLVDIQSESSLKSELIKYLFVYENYFVSKSTVDSFQDINMEMGDAHEQTNYSMTLRVSKVDRVRLNFQYNPKVFTETEIMRMAESYHNILIEMCGNVSGKVSEICAASEAERKRILEEYNPDEDNAFADRTVADCFKESVDRNRENIALIFENKEFTYGMLDSMSDCAAYRLTDMGVAKGDVVLMLLDRDESNIVIQLAALKAGAVFVPVDPLYPPERIGHIVRDSGAKIVVTNKNRDISSYPNTANYLFYEDLDFDAVTVNLPCVKSEPDDACYIIYTSGSTGKPKGCILTNRGIVNFCRNNNTLETLSGLEHVTGVSVNTVAFDFFIAESLFLLLNGFTVALANEEEQINQEKIAGMMLRNNVNIIQTTPTRFKMYIEDGDNLEHIKRLEVITLSGEELKRNLFETICSITDAVIYNPCGPSEASVWAAGGNITDCMADRNIPLHIGKPIPNVCLYVVDKGMQLLPVGVPGELCIGGVGVGKGYLNRPELTKEKFMPNPFNSGMLYRTGDLVRWNLAGNIEYMGRIDQQVKIHGLRVELGEIENVIKKVSGNDDVVVIGKDAQEDKILCAYYVSTEFFNVQEIKASMRKELPEYMVPAVFIPVERIPMTPNGKLDVRALPEVKTEYKDMFKAPETAEEKLVCAEYAKILNMERVGAEDNFFEIGGHSLRAARVINSLNKELGTKISLKDIFENPTPHQLAECIKSKLGDMSGGLVKAEIKPYYEMSSAQKRIFALADMDLNGLNYNMPSCYRVRGRLDSRRLKAALLRLTERHEVLRTGFEICDGIPVQMLHEAGAVNYEYRKSDEGLEDVFEAFVRPFALDCPPLFRVMLFENEYCEQYLLFDMHHIISDGMSMGIFTHDLCSLYNNEELKSLDYQYKDYSEWMRMAHKEEIDRQGIYWKNRFAEPVQSLDLRGDRKRPKLQSFEGNQIVKSIDGELYYKIKKYCGSKGITEFMFLLGTLTLLLAKYSRQEDIVIGSPVSGRTNADMEGIMGMFVNTLPFRENADAACSVHDFMDSIKKSCMEAYANQEYPFEELVDELKMERDLSRNPLFDVMLVLQNNEKITAEFDGAKLIYCSELNKTVSKFDMLIDVEESGNAFNIRWEYAKALFDSETISAMFYHFVKIAGVIAEDEQKTIGDIDICTDEDKRCIEANNSTEYSYERRSVVELFEEQVKKNGDKTALEAMDGELSYNVLNDKAGSVAGFLHEKGIEREEIVPFIMRRDSGMIAAMLGILKAGGAYMPVDSNYPEDRIAYMLTDSGAKFVITDRYTKDKIPSECNCEIILLEDIYETGSKLESSAGPALNELCYCIYTSGSTGKPKGTLLEHRTLSNLLVWERETQEINLSGRVLAGTTISFDVATQEIMSALAWGGTLILLADGVKTNINAYCDSIIDKKADVLFCTPSYLDLLFVQTGRAEELCGCLSDIVLAGEAMYINSRFIPYLNQVRLHNHYGPTESHVVTGITYKGDYEAEASTIGRPISNTQIYIVDKSGVMLPPGVPGELCIAGENVGRGYLNRSELTEERFIPNPFGKGVLYRTGDLARWTRQGEIEYIGRIDDQVKIRGLRIEPEEIRRTILAQEGVEDAAVIVREGENGDKNLCAYIVGENLADISELRKNLHRELAEYMVPAYMVRIDNIPVTANGKLDKRALSRIDVSEVSEYIEPENDMERLVCRCFEEVLGLNRVSVKDNFFHIGGHSLKAMMVANRLEQETGVRLDLHTIFENPDAEMLAYKLNTVAGKKHAAIPKAARAEKYHASPAQNRMYILYQMEPEAVAYNVPCFFNVKGSLDIPRLSSALREVVRHHDILRTTFHMENGDVIQRIHKAMEVELEVCSYGEMDGVEDFIRPFCLESGPLLRVRYMDCASGKLLMLDMHHIISDGVTLRNFMGELMALYQGEKFELPALQYCDYSEWLRTEQKVVLEEQSKYWLDKFSGEIPTLDLYTDYRRPLYKSYRGERLSRTLDSDLSNKIHKYTRKNNITDYMFFLGVFMVLLNKYTRQEDIVVGTPVAGRSNGDTEKLLGMFVNTLALRARPERDKYFSCFMEEIKNECLASFENQEYPFEELVDRLGVDRDTSRNPLFDVMFTMDRMGDSIALKDGLRLEIADMQGMFNIEKFDMTVNVVEENGSFRIEWSYCSALYNEAVIEGMLESFEVILNNVLEEKPLRICELPVVTKERESFIIKEWNNSRTDYRRDASIITLFQEQALGNPNHIAVRYHDRSLTYKELDAWSSLLAQKLQKHICEKDKYVAIETGKSIELIVGILAILKAGCAYVPLDMDYPKKQIEYILKDCGANIMLCSKPYALSLPVMQISFECSGPAGGMRSIKGEPEAPAYVIYTSGTTGNPKGAVIEQRSVVRLVNNTNYIKFEDTVMLQTGSISFDASTFEIWGVLLNGGTLCLADKEDILSPGALRLLIEGYGINTMFLTTTLFNQMTETDVTVFDSLRYLLFGGEMASEEHAAAFLAHNRHTRLINVYGPTECTTFALYYDLADWKPGNCVPIGEVLSNTEAYIMNDDMLCNVGMPGELCLGGDGLAREYLNNKALTDEKFYCSAKLDGKRLYRTGDLARRLPDGRIECIGRIDEQVKIRGFRIETGGILNVIRSMDDIRDCAVIVSQNKKGEKLLCAYIVSDDELDIEELRGRLEQRLPAYMIPSLMIQLDRLPVNKNGKLDRKALPEIVQSEYSSYKAPETEGEKLICEIYEEILGIGRVGSEDDFFQIGGHSLRAARLVNKIEEKTGIRIPLRAVFAERTPSKLAVMLESQTGGYAKIPAAPVKERYEMSSVQKRIFFIQDMDEESTVYNMPMCFKLSGTVCVDRMREAFCEMLNRHEILRTRLYTQEGNYYQQVLPYVKADFEFADAKEGLEEITERFVRPFDLKAGNVIRMQLVRNEAVHYMLIDMHHAVSDGMSMSIYLDEFARLYNGACLDEAVLQYKDYSEWMSGRDMSGQEAYWISEFEDGIPVAELPYDYKRGSVQSFNGGNVVVNTSEQLKKSIKDICLELGVTEYMYMLSAFMITIGKYSGREDVVIGTPISGRVHGDTGHMLGMFVNTLALRGKPEEQESIRTFVAKMKEKCLKAYENQEYPFEELVEKLDVNRDISRNPIVDIIFAMQNNELPQFVLEGAEVSYVKLDRVSSKFDLSVDVWDMGNGYAVGAEYCSDLFRENTVEDIMKHYLHILEEMSMHPDKKIGELELAPLDERDKILNIWNQGASLSKETLSVVKQFELQAERTPNAIAVVFEDKSITYEELNGRANAIAQRLKAEGIASGDFVCLLCERSIHMIAGMYGILKSGAAYVPVDPSYPGERIEYIINDSNARAVVSYLTESEEMIYENGIEVIKNLSIPVIHIDDSKAAVTAAETGYCGDDMMYVIYTSGTTGKPKGAAITHKSFANLTDWYIRHFSMTEEERVMLVSSICFDAAQKNIFAPLCCGGRVIIYNIDDLDYRTLTETIVKNRVTLINCANSLFNPVVQENSYNDFADLKSLRVVALGGEAFNCVQFRNWVSSPNCNARLYNVYGPTECTDISAVYECTREDIMDRDTVPVGRPIDNVQIYILKANLLCAAGMPGELCIAGAGVGCGYINNEQLTKEKFRNNPFGSGRIYQTGDLARFDCEGNIVFMGRIDEQIKIRGYRLEVQEIENVIKKQPYVRDCIVIAKKDYGDEMALYAYIVPEKEVSISAIREGISKELPDYMIPSYMCMIDRIPVTSNGKADRKRLPDITEMTGSSYIRPENETERRICDAFAEVLGIDTVGAEDNFFMLGGHSLRAVKVINKLEAEFGVRIPLKRMFTEKTPRALAKYIEGRNAAYKAIPQAPKREYYPMSSQQKRLYTLCRMDVDSKVYNMPSLMEIQGDMDEERLIYSLKKLMERHEVLRTGFSMVKTELIQTVYNDVEPDYKRLDMAAMPEYAELIQPFELGRPPLLRVRYINCRDRQYLFFDMHHIISDGMSVNILIRDWRKLYSGEELEPLRLQYKDYSEWMRLDRTEDMERQREYWLEKFSDIPVVDLPKDFSRPNVQSFKGATCKQNASADLVREIDAFCMEHEVTPYMFWLGNIMLLLAQYSGKEDIVVGNTVSGRTNGETEQLLGMFVNTTVMRETVSGDSNYLNYLNRIKEECIRVQENQEYPFEELLDSLNIERDISRNPLYDVMLVYQNNEAVDMEMGALELKGIDISDSSRVSRLDLSFNLYIEAGELVISAEYCTELFRKETIMRMCRRLLNIASGIIKDPDRCVGDIMKLNEGETEEIKYNLNPSLDKMYLSYANIIQMIASSAENINNIALEYHGRTVTYYELAAVSRQLAGSLLHRFGSLKNKLVAVRLERDERLVFAMLGILMAGGAYILLDSGYPEERIHYILEDSRAKCIITDSDDAFTYTVEKLDINTLLKETVGMEYSVEIESSDLCYCIYTSGSTGKPKGVMIEHGNIVSLAQAYREFYEGVEAVAAITVSTFDVFNQEILLSLMLGIKIVLAGTEELYNAEKMAALIDGNANCMVLCAPTKFKAYFMAGGKKFVSSVHSLIFGGEKFDAGLFSEIKQIKPDIRIYNAYGPSETAIAATMKEVKDTGDISIGKPLGNSNIYIVDKAGNMLPPGVYGEICICGRGVGRGYLNNPDMTAAGFTDNPFGEGRMYRTGDIGRWNYKGEVEFWGRADNQVKIRGLRIELGEIEDALKAAAGIEDAVVTAAGESGGSFLCAYYTSGEKLSKGDIKKQLLRILPEYMVPDVYIRIAAVPFTENGKVDYGKLPKAEFVCESKYAPPVTEKQEVLCHAVAEVLSVDNVSIYSDFFEIGGDSIKAIQAAASVRERGYTIEVKDFLTLREIELIADKMELTDCSYSAEREAAATEVFIENNVVFKRIKELVSNSVMEYNKNMRCGKLRYTYSPSTQQRMFLNGKSSIIYQTVDIGDCCDEERLVYILKELTARRTIFTSYYNSLTNCIEVYDYCESDIPVIYADELGLKDNEADYYIEAIQPDISQSMELSENVNLLSRFVLVRKGSGQYTVILVIHHCIWDAMSGVVFERGLKALLCDKAEKPELDKYISSFDYGRHISEVNDNSRNYLCAIENGEQSLKDLIHFKKTLTEYGHYINCGSQVNMMFAYELDDAEKSTAMAEPFTFSAELYKEIAVGAGIKDFPDNAEIPILFMNHGRKSDNAEIMEALGMYLDCIPVCVPLKTPADNNIIAERIRCLSDLKKAYGISLLDILSGEMDNVSGKAKGIGVINFKGIFDTGHFNIVKKEKFQNIDSVTDVEYEDYAFALEIDFIGNHIIFTVICSKASAAEIKKGILRKLKDLGKGGKAE